MGRCTPSSHVLERAGISDGSIEVLFEGFDVGEPAPGEGTQPYLRSLPIDVAMHPDTLLAYEMNGEPLSREHGYPVRLDSAGLVWHGFSEVAEAHIGATRAV